MSKKIVEQDKAAETVEQEKTVDVTAAEKPKKADKNKQLLIDAFKNWPDVKELYQTEDGTCFFNRNTAELHAKATGGEVTCYSRNEVIQ